MAKPIKQYLLGFCALALLHISVSIEAHQQSSIIDKLAQDWQQLPEQQIAHDQAQSVYAQYAEPTKRYSHGILGDAIEAQALVVAVDGKFYEHRLGEQYVFEDIRPRLFDVDQDGELEFITIRSHLSKGAGIVIYKLSEAKLIEYAVLEEIQTANRWLNIATLHDIDSDGVVELVWIETPHIGGILKIARIVPGRLEVIDTKRYFSNHAIGERNLCLSILSKRAGQTVFYVPNQKRDSIVGFVFKDNRLQEVERRSHTTDFSQSLRSQLAIPQAIDQEINCIH